MSISSNKESTENADFETAISATKFGKFNYLLIICSIPTAMTPIIDNSVMSYVLPIAQCDLNLTLQQKGMLNSAVFVGYILSSYLWGFLGDTIGRKKMLLIACTLDFVFNFFGAFTQLFLLQYMFKLLAGFVACGPYALIITYMSEFHSSLYRSKVVMFIGVSMVTSLIFTAVLAWVIMPLPNMYIYTYVLYPWQLYMLISCIPTFISSIVFIFLPESPKFLMSSGQNENALKIFKTIYRFNTGRNEDTYPIKGLIIENINTKNNDYSIQNLLKIFHLGYIQLKPLFHKPYFSQILLCIIIHFGILSGANTLRLWLPQIFTSIDEYNQIFGTTNGTLCEVIELSFGNRGGGNSTEIEEESCQVVFPQNQVFINSIIVAFSTLLGNLILVAIINHYPKKQLLAYMVTIGGCTAYGLYWTQNQNVMLTISSVFLTLVTISSTTLMSLVVELFPTTLRSLAVSLTIMAGQLGAFLGNLFFPYLLQAGCLPPFLYLGSIVTCCGILCLILPNPTGKNFK